MLSNNLMLHKNIIPITFCFDNQMELAAGVCITSLLLNAEEDTFYDIFILHAEECSFENSLINELPGKYLNCRITYRSVGSSFASAFEIRGITIAAYYRLLIPEVIPEYDKMIYSDVDVIFREDLKQIFDSTDLDDKYVGGVVDGANPGTGHKKYISSLGLDPEEYIYSGNLIFNSAKIRQDGLVDKFIKEALKQNYIYQDMDVLNIVCKGGIKRMPPSFCLCTQITNCAVNQMEQPFYAMDELSEALSRGIVHYAGPKPWNQLCLNFDIWWEYYRKSIFFDEKFYYEFYRSRLNIFDTLTLWKRIKILLRYFYVGVK